MNNSFADIFSSSHYITSFSKEEALSLILNNLEDSFLLIDKNLNIIITSERTKEKTYSFLGKKLTPGMSVLELAPPERHPFLRKLYEEVFKGLEKKTETQVAHNTYTQYFEHHFKPARNEKNEIIGAVVSTRDIIENKSAQTALKESEERWRFALEGSKQGVWDWNIQTGEVFYSDSYKRMYGFKDDELKDRIEEWKERVHPDDVKKINAALQDHLSSKEPYYESTYRIQTKNEGYIWVMARGMLSRDENGLPVRMIGTHTNITNQLTIEEELRKSNERFLFVSKATSDAIYDWNLQTNELYWGDGIQTLFGYKSKQVPLIVWENLIFKDDQTRIHESLQKALSNPDVKFWKEEYRFAKADGNFSYVLDRGFIIRNEDGMAVRMIGSMQDVSERKNLEQELLKNELERQKAINQATVETQEQERSEIGKELHDNVNQVLTTTKLYLDLAVSNPELKDELIKKSTKNILSVINEIRQLSRSLMDPSIGDLGLIDSIHDLVENINLTRKLHVRLVPDKKVELLLSKTHKLTIFRIIQEALNNAIRHAKATSVVISFKTTEKMVEVIIQDDGIGFDVKLAKKGAGLKNIQNRIYLINGTYIIESAPEKGCKIIINFPVPTNEH